MFKRPKQMAFNKFKELRKTAAEKLDSYLKGRIVKGTESVFKGPRTPKWRDGKKHRHAPSFLRQLKKYRKMRRKMAYKSKRINRLRAK